MEEVLIKDLNQIYRDLAFILPEIILGLSIVFIILADLLLKRRYPGLNRFFLFLSLSITALSIFRSGHLNISDTTFLFSNFLMVSSSTYKIKLILTLIAALVIPFIPDMDKKRDSIFISLFLSILLGTFFMISSGSLLTIYLGIEVVSLSSYMLVAFNTDSKSFEASIKYLIFGAAASGVMLFGFSWMYGVTGSIYLSPEFFNDLAAGPRPFVLTSIIFVFAGFLFKVGAFPLHIWIPDAYEGSDSSVAAFLSIVPKTAGIIVIFYFLNGLEGSAFIDPVRQLLLVSSIFSMLLGTFAAIRQTVFQRLLAYSSIAHSGFLLSIICAPSSDPLSAFFFYTLMYALANYCVFFINGMMISKHGFRSVEQYSLPFPNRIIYGISILIAVTSLVGIPPFAGFTAKLLLFSGLWESYAVTGNTFVLTAFSVGLLTAIAGLFYYMKVPYQIFIKSGNHSDELSISIAEAAVLALYVVPLIVIFFQPEWILKLIADI